MFEWRKKKYLDDLAAKAGAYTDSQFITPEEEKRKAEAEKLKQAVITATAKQVYQNHVVLNEPHVQYQRWSGDGSYSLEDNYDDETIGNTLRNMSSSAPASRILNELDANKNMTFVEKMLEHIDKRHLLDSDVYKTAQVDRRLFSKIISDRDYKPSKDTCVAFALALKLPLSEAEDLLSRAGYTLSHSNKRDLVIEFFFKERIYNLNELNSVLYRLDQKLIGR